MPVPKIICVFSQTIIAIIETLYMVLTMCQAPDHLASSWPSPVGHGGCGYPVPTSKCFSRWGSCCWALRYVLRKYFSLTNGDKVNSLQGLFLDCPETRELPWLYPAWKQDWDPCLLKPMMLLHAVSDSLTV